MIFEHFKNRLDEALRESSLAQLYFQDPQYVAKMELSNGLLVACGATRLCLIDEGSEFVVKCTYCGDNGNDPCEREVTAYENACDRGVEMYFAAPQYIGTYEWHGVGYDVRDAYRELNIDFENETDNELDEDIRGTNLKKKNIYVRLEMYAYPKASSYPIASFHPSEETKSYVRSIFSPLSKRNENITTLFVEKCGKEMFSRINSFLMDNDINDLHCGNIGMIDGMPIFIDYAGFYEDSSNDDDWNSQY